MTQVKARPTGKYALHVANGTGYLFIWDGSMVEQIPMTDAIVLGLRKLMGRNDFRVSASLTKDGVTDLFIYRMSFNRFRI